MNIQYKIIKKFPADRQIVVRFFTPILTVFNLASELEVGGTPILDEQGQPKKCRTDFLVQFPLKAITPEEEKTIIMQNCPWKWMEDEERIVNSKTNTDAVVEAVNASIMAMSESVGVLNFEDTPAVTEGSIKAANIIKIDADVDAIYAQAIGNRATEYSEAEVQASAYKAAGYTGDVPAYVAIWVATNTKGFTTAKQSADDILSQAVAWRGAAEAMRSQRLSCKKEIIDGVPMAMEKWSGFVKAIRTQIFQS